MSIWPHFYHFIYQQNKKIQHQTNRWAVCCQNGEHISLVSGSVFNLKIQYTLKLIMFFALTESPLFQQFNADSEIIRRLIYINKRLKIKTRSLRWFRITFHKLVHNLPKSIYVWCRSAACAASNRFHNVNNSLVPFECLSFWWDLKNCYISWLKSILIFHWSGPEPRKKKKTLICTSVSSRSRGKNKKK